MKIKLDYLLFICSLKSGVISSISETKQKMQINVFHITKKIYRYFHMKNKDQILKWT